MRLNQFLAAAGLGSRRACEQLIRDGRVDVNRRRVTQLATRVDPDDVVRCDSRIVAARAPVVLMLHKPRGPVCSTQPEGTRPSVFDWLPPDQGRLFYVGRLDADSEGLLLFTNDGDLAQALTHPRHRVEKVYEAVLDRPFDPADTRVFQNGSMRVEGKPARFEQIRPLRGTCVEVTLAQGLKRQIRVMFGYRGYTVERLKRVRLGPLRLEGLASGRWRPLTPREITALRNAAQPAAPSRPKRRARPKPPQPSP
jgi:23S rRNA pseudouridine2605 synthase